MNSQPAFASKLLTPSALCFVLVCAQPALAQPVSQSQIGSARQSYAKSQEKVHSLRSKHTRSTSAFRQTGSQRSLSLAGKQQNRLQEAKVEKVQAKARYERLLGIQAKQEGLPAQAHKHNSASQRLFKQAKAMERALLQTGRQVPQRAAKKNVAKKSVKSERKQSGDQVSAKVSANARAESSASEAAPAGAGTSVHIDPGLFPLPAAKGIASRPGKQQIKRYLKDGEVGSALDILRRMESEPSRDGLRGKLDSWRKGQMRNKVVNTAQKEALVAVQAGNAMRAAEMSQVLLDEHKAPRLRNADKLAAKMVRKVENAAVAQAETLIGTGNYRESRQLMVLARQIQQVQHRAPSKKMQQVQRAAHQNVIGQMEKAANAGDIGSYLAARKLALQFHKEAKGDGAANPALLQANKRLYLKARKNSVNRALNDALRLANGSLGGVAVGEAEMYLRYAKDTRSMLTKRGDKLSRKDRKLFAKVEKKINKTKLAQSTMHAAKKPGIGRRLWNATFSVKGKHQYIPQAPTSLEDFRGKFQIEDLARQHGVTVPEMRQMIRQEQQRQMEQEQAQINQMAQQLGMSPEELIQQLRQEDGLQTASVGSGAGPVVGAQPRQVNPEYNSPGFNFGNGGGAGFGGGFNR